MFRPLLPSLGPSTLVQRTVPLRDRTVDVTTIQGPSNADWERHRPLIIQLYVDERKKLKEIVNIMARKGHYASPNMYKTRFTKWGLAKNKKDSDMLILLRKTNERMAAGKKTVFRVSDGEVSVEEVMQYFSKKKKIPRKQVQDMSAGSTPPHISYRTPSPTLLSSPSTPQSLFVSEQLFTNIGTYIGNSYSPGKWIRNADGGYTALDSSGNSIPDLCEEFWHYCDLAAQWSGMQTNKLERSPVKFRRALSQAFALIGRMITYQHPRTLIRVFMILYFFAQIGLSDVSSMMAKYLGNMAKTLFVQEHPWARICHLIGTLDVEAMNIGLAHYSECAVDVYESTLGLGDPFTLMAKTDFITSVYRSDLLRAEILLREIQASVDDHGITISLMHNLINQKRYEEAIQFTQDFLARLREEEYERKAVALSSLSNIHYLQGNMDCAEQILRDAITVMAEAGAYGNPLVFFWTGYLKRWLREWGRNAEADELEMDPIEDEVLGANELEEYRSDNGHITDS